MEKIDFDPDAPLFQFYEPASKPPWPEGMLVFHSQLGIGMILRPDQWGDPGEKPAITRAHNVAFLGYAPAMIVGFDALRPVAINGFKWESLWPEPPSREEFTVLPIKGISEESLGKALLEARAGSTVNCTCPIQHSSRSGQLCGKCGGRIG